MTGNATVGVESDGCAEVCNEVSAENAIKQAESGLRTIIAPIMTDSHPPTPLRILHLEDAEPDHLLLVREFRKAATPVIIDRVDQLDTFVQALAQHPYDVVLADYRLPGFTALDAWQRMQSAHIHLPVVLLSGAIGESLAVQAIQAGISDYVAKDDLSRIRRVTQRAIEMHALRLAKEQADAELARSERQLARFAQHLQSTIEHERAALAREVHDDIGGALAALRFDLSWLQRHTIDAESLAHLQTATQTLQHAVEAAQRLMMNLRPAILDHGVVEALQWLHTNFSKRTSIPVSLHVPATLAKLPKDVELTVFRTAQEALTNIGKHAHCTAARIELACDARHLTLEISDNGHGMSAHASPQTGGFGLKGLQERAKTIGGWIDISSSPGAGTAITLTIPLTKPTPAEGESKP